VAALPSCRQRLAICLSLRLGAQEPRRCVTQCGKTLSSTLGAAIFRDRCKIGELEGFVLGVDCHIWDLYRSSLPYDAIWSRRGQGKWGRAMRRFDVTRAALTILNTAIFPVLLCECSSRDWCASIVDRIGRCGEWKGDQLRGSSYSWCRVDGGRPCHPGRCMQLPTDAAAHPERLQFLPVKRRNSTPSRIQLGEASTPTEEVRPTISLFRLMGFTAT
jgi:hypothetical protein